MNRNCLSSNELGYVSIPALMQYIESAERCGIARKEIFNALELDNQVLENRTKRIPGEVLQKILRFVIPKSGDPLFGLHTAQYISPSSYSVLGYIVMNAANIGEAMGKINQYEKLVGDMGVTTIRQAENCTEIQWNCHYSDPLVRSHLIDNVLASWVTYTRWLAESDKAPKLVMIEHAAPDKIEQTKAYEQLFACEVRFNQAYSAILIDDKTLSTPLKHADRMLLKTLEQHASQQLSDLDDSPSFGERVRHTLAFLLPKELPRKEQVANYLNVSERTLQRRLQQEGTNFQQILDTLRCQLVQQYLQNPELSNEDIAEQLGFQELRSFHRFFKRTMAMTPGQYKKRHHL